MPNDLNEPGFDQTESAEALDAAFAALDDAGVEIPAETPADEASKADTLPEKQTEDAPAADTSAEAKPDDDTLPENQEPEAKPDADDKQRLPLEEDAAATPAEDDDPIIKALNAVKLRSDASDKTKSTFENLKKLSADGLRAAREDRQKLLDQHKKDVEEARRLAVEEAAKTPTLPDDVKKELEELRQLRARVDVESDPEFKAKFDARRDGNYESIYGLLKAHGLPDAQLEVLKKLPEADRVEEVGRLAEKLPSTERRRIEAKLFDNLNIDEARQKALTDARAKAEELATQRTTQTKQQQEEAEKAHKAAVEKFSAQKLFQPVDIPAGTPAEEKKRLESVNANAARLKKLYEETVNDPSPDAKAEAAFGLVLAHTYKAKYDAEVASRKALEIQLAAIKKRGSFNDAGSVVNTPASKRKSSADDGTTYEPGDALDKLAQEHGVNVR